MKAEVEDLRNLLSKIQYLIESSHENVPLNELKNIHTDLSMGISNVESQLKEERELFHWYYNNSYENHVGPDVSAETIDKFREVEIFLTSNPK